MIEAVLKRNQPDLVQFSRDYLSARSGKARLSSTFSNRFGSVRLPHLFSRSPRFEIDRASLSPSLRNVKAKTRAARIALGERRDSIFRNRARFLSAAPSSRNMELWREKIRIILNYLHLSLFFFALDFESFLATVIALHSTDRFNAKIWKPVLKVFKR